MGSQIFWSVVVGFLTGVCVRSFFMLGRSFIFFLLVLAAAALAFVFLKHSKRTHYILTAAALFSCAAGIVRMQSATLFADPQLQSVIGKSVKLEGEVVAEPDARENSTLVTLAVSHVSYGTSSTAVSGNVLAQLPPHARISYGDRVRISGKLRLPEPFATNGEREFQYPQYLAVRRIAYTVSRARVEEQLGQGGNPLYASALALKQTYLDGLRRTMPDPEAALAGGITVGDKRSVGAELSQDFQRDSLVHMLVLSGYNITVVANALSRVLAGASRYVQFSGSISVVAFFLLISGGASSAARAGLMTLIAVFARLTHRTYLGERALAAVSLVLVAWNPWIVCFDPSFQLSALATLGLIFYTPVFARLFSRVPETAGLREILASTCGTQLMVLPLLLFQNGTLSLVALPANVLALPPVPLAMLFSMFAAFGGIVFGTYASWIALPAYALLWYITTIAQLFAAIPFAAIDIPAFGVWWVVGAYALLLIFSVRTRHLFA